MCCIESNIRQEPALALLFHRSPAEVARQLRQSDYRFVDLVFDRPPARRLGLRGYLVPSVNMYRVLGSQATDYLLDLWFDGPCNSLLMIRPRFQAVSPLEASKSNLWRLVR